MKVEYTGKKRYAVEYTHELKREKRKLFALTYIQQRLTSLLSSSCEDET